MTTLTALNGATIAFDLDGTLVESAPDIIGAVNAVLAAEGLQPLAYTKARPFVSRGARWLLQWGLASAGASDPQGRAAALFGSFLANYSARLVDESRLFPGVIESVQGLRAAGAKLVVCTNKPTDLSRRLLAELGIADHFHGIVGIDAVSCAKPDPAHLIEAVAAVGGDLSRAVMVGDSEIDADTARAAGTALILVEFGYTEVPAHQLAPDALLHHFEELAPACIGVLGKRRSLPTTVRR